MTETAGQDAELPESTLTGEMLYQGAVPAVVGALVGAATGHLVDGATGIYLGAAVGTLWQETGKTLKARQNRAKESAAITTAWTSCFTGLGPEQISAWAEADDQRLQLIGSTYQAALASLDRAKLKALARVLSEAVEDDAKLDLAWLVTNSLAEMEPAHVRVLRAMCCEPEPKRGLPDFPMSTPGWHLTALEARFPNLAGGIRPIMATFTRHAMAFDHYGPRAAEPVWELTDYGRRVFGYLLGDAK